MRYQPAVLVHHPVDHLVTHRAIRGDPRHGLNTMVDHICAAAGFTLDDLSRDKKVEMIAAFGGAGSTPIELQKHWYNTLARLLVDEIAAAAGHHDQRCIQLLLLALLVPVMLARERTAGQIAWMNPVSRRCLGAPSFCRSQPGTRNPASAEI